MDKKDIISKLNDNEKIVMREISRIEKSPKGCFNTHELAKKHKIKKNNINIKNILSTLINKGLIIKGNKKDTYCTTHEGKLIEHKLEEYFNKNNPYRIVRNKYS